MKHTLNLKAERKLRWNSEAKCYDTSTVTGEVTFQINLEAIMSELGARALLNRTGKARFLNGWILATATHRHEEAAK